MSSFKKKLEVINHKLHNSYNSLKNIKDLNNEINLLCSDSKEMEKLSIEDKKFLYFIQVKISRLFFSFADAWQKGEVEFDEEELWIVEYFNNEYVKGHIEKLENYENSPNLTKEEKENLKKTIKEIKEWKANLSKFIQQEKDRQQKQQPDQSSNSPTSSDPEINQLKDRLNQLQKQNPTDNSNNSQFQQIQEQLNALQNQIQNLENKIQGSPSTPTSQQKKQELVKLKHQTQQLQKDLSNKQINSQTTSGDKFNWLYVVIPGGVLILAMAVIIAYLLGKRNKKE